VIGDAPNPVRPNTVEPTKTISAARSSVSVLQSPATTVTEIHTAHRHAPSRRFFALGIFFISISRRLADDLSRCGSA
jgi:hypothetical protein